MNKYQLLCALSLIFALLDASDEGFIIEREYYNSWVVFKVSYNDSRDLYYVAKKVRKSTPYFFGFIPGTADIFPASVVSDLWDQFNQSYTEKYENFHLPERGNG